MPSGHEAGVARVDRVAAPSCGATCMQSRQRAEPSTCEEWLTQTFSQRQPVLDAHPEVVEKGARSPGAAHRLHRCRLERQQKTTAGRFPTCHLPDGVRRRASAHHPEASPRGGPGCPASAVGMASDPFIGAKIVRTRRLPCQIDRQTARHVTDSRDWHLGPLRQFARPSEFYRTFYRTNLTLSRPRVTWDA